eukprot:2720385-Alexandrium_andersonii.AAC.1
MRRGGLIAQELRARSMVSPPRRSRGCSRPVCSFFQGPTHDTCPARSRGHFSSSGTGERLGV